MVLSSPARVRARAAIVCGVGSLLVSVVSVAPAHAAAPCPEPYPLTEVAAGLTGEGLTVDQGTVPEPFTVTVEGVVKDGIGPGKDLIVADTDSEAIRRVGGIWYGMSGSPVYTSDGRLLGAVAYGGSLGPSSLAGITPAQYMYDLLSAPPGAGPAAAAQSADQVDIPAGMQARLVASGDMTAAEAGAGFSRLRVPLGVSGGLLPSVRAEAERRFGGDGFRVYAAGSVPTAASQPTDIVPGGNFAAAFAYGDAAAVGVGTATAVCGSEVLAFGHPFMFEGATTFSAHGADAVTIQDDSTLGPYKIANPTGPVGTVDQDRLAGLRGRMGTLPATVPVTSHVQRQSDGSSRDGSTQVPAPGWLADAAAYHLYFNVIAVLDEYGFQQPGTASADWTIRGARDDGSTWTLTSGNRYADTWDIAYQSADDLFWQLNRLHSNRYADPRIQSVSIDSTVDGQYTDYTLGGVSALVNGEWRPVSRSTTLRLVAGTRQRFRVVLKPYRGTDTRTVEVAVPVPPGTVGSSGELQLGGGGDLREGSRVTDFDSLLASMQSAPRNDDLVARLRLYDWKRGTTRKSGTRARVDRVVNGSTWFDARVVATSKARPTAVTAGSWTVADSLRPRPGTALAFRFGKAGTRPLAGDWDGNGVVRPATFSAGTWTVRRSPTRVQTFTFGQAGDLPVAGDWDGDGRDSSGVYRDGRWLLRNTVGAGAPDLTFDFGDPSALAVAGDWDGDGVDTVGTFAAGRWRLRDTLTAGPPDTSLTFGRFGDVPVVGDWDGSGRVGLGVFRSGGWLLTNALTAGPPDYRLTFGASRASPTVWR